MIAIIGAMKVEIDALLERMSTLTFLFSAHTLADPFPDLQDNYKCSFSRCSFHPQFQILFYILSAQATTYKIISCHPFLAPQSPHFPRIFHKNILHSKSYLYNIAHNTLCQYFFPHPVVISCHFFITAP